MSNRISITWAPCPACGRKTKLKLRSDTILRAYLLFCPRCHREMLIDAEANTITRAQELPC